MRVSRSGQNNSLLKRKKTLVRSRKQNKMITEGDPLFDAEKRFHNVKSGNKYSRVSRCFIVNIVKEIYIVSPEEKNEI